MFQYFVEICCMNNWKRYVSSSKTSPRENLKSAPSKKIFFLDSSMSERKFRQRILPLINLPKNKITRFHFVPLHLASPFATDSLRHILAQTLLWSIRCFFAFFKIFEDFDFWILYTCHLLEQCFELIFSNFNISTHPAQSSFPPHPDSRHPIHQTDWSTRKTSAEYSTSRPGPSSAPPRPIAYAERYHFCSNP